jgi:Transposase IS66 family
MRLKPYVAATRARRENQVCLSHFIRDVQYAIDAGDSIFAPELRHLLGRACRIGRQRERLTDATLKAYAARLEARLDELMARTPAHAAGSKLQRIVKKIRRHLFVFVTNRDIPRPTTAPSGRYGPAPCSGKSPTVFVPNGARNSMPISDPSSKLPAAAPSERSKPSASHWPECRSRTLPEPHAATGGLSNYP